MVTNQLLKENERYSGKEICDSSEIVEKYPFTKKFFEWVNFGAGPSMKAVCLCDQEHDAYNIILHSEHYKYNIYFNGDYIGGGYSRRAEEPFEDWLRGNDLTDGHEGKDTFETILYEIIEHEMINVVVKPDYVDKSVAGEKVLADD